MLNRTNFKSICYLHFLGKRAIYYTGLFTLLFMIVFVSQAKEKEDISASSPPVKKKTKASDMMTNSSDNIKGWKVVRKMNGVSTYALLNNRSTLGVFHSQALEKPLSWKEARSKEFFEQVKESKKKVLGLMKITNWEVSSQEWKRRRGYLEWNLEGSYNNSSGERVYFKENHLYFPDKLHQILLTSDEEGFFKTTKDEDFIKVAQRELIRVAASKKKGQGRVVKTKIQDQ